MEDPASPPSSLPAIPSPAGSSGSQPPSQDNGLESTHIPKAYARWQEESIALDGHAPHLCVRVLRESLIRRLVAIYREENAAAKDPAQPKTKTSQSGTTTTTAAAPSTSVAETSAVPSAPLQVGGTGGGAEGSGAGGHTIPVAPHPSDQVTPSSHSPREGGSSVDQLRSSLRQVADALAQTVAAVRTTREQLLGGREEEDQEEGQEFMETRETQEVSPPATAPPPTAQTTLANALQLTSEESVPVTSSSVTPTSPSLLATFDGSQESAAVTLASTDPDDPLHTFLSAIVGAPAPPLSSHHPLPITTTSTGSVTTALLLAPFTATPPLVTTPPVTVTSVSPRLPVFTRLQQSDSNPSAPSDSRVGGSSPLAASALQDRLGILSSSGATPPLPAISTVPATSTTAPSQSLPQPALPSSQPALPASQGTLDSHASVLAEELARVVSRLVPSSSSSSSTTSYSTGSLLPPVGVAIGDVTSGQSPSPSDMLAPLLMTSLQMPSNSSGTSLGEAEATPNTEAPPTSSSAFPSAIELLDRERLLVSGRPPHRPMATPTSSMETATPMLTPASSISQTVAQSVTTPTTQPLATPTTASVITPPVTTTQSLREGSGAQAPPTLTPIDPTFLAALPDSIRQEVMAQHEREQRLRQLRAQRDTNVVSTISPEFLAALPPNIQEEVCPLCALTLANVHTNFHLCVTV